LVDLKIKGILAAFGDFDSDKFTDLFVITNNGDSFAIYLAEEKYPHFSESKLECFINKGKKIVGLIPGDFQGKAVMDIIVIGSNMKSDFFLYLVKGNKTHLLCESLLQDQCFAKVKNQPLSLDFNGDMISDLLAQDVDGKRYVYSYFKDQVWNKTLFEGGNFRIPNSNAFIDLNNDFATDIFIEGESFEYWCHSNKGFQKCNEIPIPNYKVIGSSTFIDIDSDGTIDHILPVCEDKDCQFSAILALNKKENNWTVLAHQFTDLTNVSSFLGLIPNLEFDNFIFPLKLRHADVDGDGYPDLISVMRHFKTSPNNHKLIILQNTRTEDNPFGRTFVPTWLVFDSSSTNSNPILASFFDLGENGQADVFFTSKLKKGPSSYYTISASTNDQMIDACFLKVMVTTGLCYRNCPALDDFSLGSSSPFIRYGTNQPGPSVNYRLIDPEGNKRIGFAGQLSQSSDFSLQMPYSIFGLGKLPNFVDNLTASVPGLLDKNPKIQSWFQIVPDAQVVVIPYPPQEPRLWRIKLFITPSDIVLSTLITLGCICCILILIILLLHRKEVLEDLAEHEEYRRHWPESR